MEQIGHTLSLCYIIRESYFDRPFLINKNIEVLRKGILRYLEETEKHFSEEEYIEE